MGGLDTFCGSSQASNNFQLEDAGKSVEHYESMNAAFTCFSLELSADIHSSPSEYCQCADRKNTRKMPLCITVPAYCKA